MPTRESDEADRRARHRRREYAKLAVATGGLAAVASLLAPTASLARVFDEPPTAPVYRDGLALVDGTGRRIEMERLSDGEQLTVFPEGAPITSRATTLLVRFPAERYGGATRLAYTVAGYAAYSAVCTHAGCTVSQREGDILVCPCHSGRYDPLSGARVVGGPPPRSLPQLPITLSAEGYLVATGAFEGPIGPGGG
jgi:rieske iron-sulfur protein